MTNTTPSFGFNMGPNMGDFAIMEANTNPVPPTPQPKYMTVAFPASQGGGPLDPVFIVNTTNAVFLEASGDPITGIWGIKFTGAIYAVSFDNVYIEGFYNINWQNTADDTIPRFQIQLVDEQTIAIMAVANDTSFTLVEGFITFSLIVFE